MFLKRFEKYFEVYEKLVVASYTILKLCLYLQLEKIKKFARDREREIRIPVVNNKNK